MQWVLFGYSLAFGNDIGHFVGDLSKPLFDEDEEMGLDTTQHGETGYNLV